MRMKKVFCIVLVVALCLFGLLKWWPIAALAVAAGALLAPPLGVGLGLVLDIAWGAPPGALHFLYFPWTLLALVIVSARALAPKFFFSRGSDTL